MEPTRLSHVGQTSPDGRAYCTPPSAHLGGPAQRGTIVFFVAFWYSPTRSFSSPMVVNYKHLKLPQIFVLYTTSCCHNIDHHFIRPLYKFWYAFLSRYVIVGKFFFGGRILRTDFSVPVFVEVYTKCSSVKKYAPTLTCWRSIRKLVDLLSYLLCHSMQIV